MSYYTLELHQRILALEKWANTMELVVPKAAGLLGSITKRDHLAIAIDGIAKQFPEIVGIRHSIGTDASGLDFLDVRVLLTDEAATGKFLGSITRRICDSLKDTIIGRDNWPLWIRTNFRSASEQATMKDPDWEPSE